ncbi:MAG TPA: S53 family peptidase [Thermoleophilaceae bacterium]|nr:S53 family peptidase [Thermoleophilaceae bacterium]
MRLAAALAVCAISLAAGAVAVAAPPVRTTLNGNRPAWAAAAERLATVPSTRQIDISVYLPWRNAADLASFAAEVSDPQSAHYRQYLTPAQFRARFSPAQSDVNAVSSWLRSQGLHVTGSPASNQWIEARGTVAAVSQAFGTTLGYYDYRGEQDFAPDREPSVPPSIAGKILAIAGLEDASFVKQDAAPPTATVTASPCSAYWGEHMASDKPPAFGRVQPYVPCGYTPTQLQGAYGLTRAIKSGTDGRGQAVGIVDAYAAGTIEQDVDEYSSRHGLPPVDLTQTWATPNLDQKSGSDSNHCGEPAGWYGEETLDVEAVHAMAPGASIIYSGAADCGDRALLAAVSKLLDDGRAQIITNSYGSLGEGVSSREAQAEDSVYQQAAAQGVGLYFSSGDSGDESTSLDHPEPDFPASDPWVTGVGGTSLAVGAANNYLFETGWGTDKTTLTDGAWSPSPPGDFLYGAGGGTSKLFSQPSYQQGVVPQSLSGAANPMRLVPDVAALGDPNTGMLIGETQTFGQGEPAYGEYRIGGTSLAAPLFAGMMALADQAAGFHHGFANPALYRLAGTSAFHDIVPSTGQLAVVRNDYKNGVDDSGGVTTSLRTLDHDSSLATAPGYDNVTGLGTPNGAAFLAGLAVRPGS